MNVRDINIKEILPQREPFLMISVFTTYTPEYSESELDIKDDNIFCKNGLFTQAGLVENIAQTCAARIGYYNKYILKKKVTIGFIGAVKSLQFLKLPASGSTIHTRIDIIEEIFNLSLVTAQVYEGEELIAKGRMTIALSENETE